MSPIPPQGARGPAAVDSARGAVLALRRPGLWRPAVLAIFALSAVAGLTSPWILGTSDALPALAEPLRIAGWVALAGTIPAGALGWAWRWRTCRIVFEGDGFWMPPRVGVSGFIWVPYQEVHAVHPWKAWRLRGRRQLALALRGRLSRFWSEGAFVEPDALERFAISVRAGVARLPEGAERLREIDRRSAAAAAAQRGWPVVSLCAVLVLAGVFWMDVWLRDLNQQILHLFALSNSPEALANGELFRWVTGSLLHVDGGHLAVNLLGLLVMGSLCERLVGGRRFVVVLLGSSLGCAVLSSALVGPSMGASGAISGALGCQVYTMVAYRDEAPANFYPPLWWCAVCLALVIVVEASWPGNVNHVGHLSGFLAGVALAAVVVRGRPLAALTLTPSRLATGLAVGLLAIYAGGVAWGMLTIQDMLVEGRAALESALLCGVTG